jgi:hypothetical protein
MPPRRVLRVRALAVAPLMVPALRICRLPLTWSALAPAVLLLRLPVLVTLSTLPATRVQGPMLAPLMVVVPALPQAPCTGSPAKPAMAKVTAQANRRGAWMG